MGVTHQGRATYGSLGDFSEGISILDSTCKSGKQILVISGGTDIVSLKTEKTGLL